MEHFTNYQQMIAPAMVWESIERNDAVKMAVSFSWKNQETTVLMNGVRNGSSGIRSECLPLPQRNITRPESW